MKLTIVKRCVWASIVLLLGCGASEKKSEMTPSGSAASPILAGRVADQIPLKKDEFKNQRLLIKNANLSIEVENYDSTCANVKRLLDGIGGYVAITNTRGDHSKSGSMELRVPQSVFENVISNIKKMAKYVENENISSEDVTEEYYDNNARLENKKAEELQIREIYKKAYSVDDILRVQAELFRVREEIERLQGHQNLLTHRIEMSRISLQLYEKGASKPGFWLSLGEAFVTGFDQLQFVLSALIVLAIAGIPVFVILYLMIRIWKKRRKEIKP